MVARTSPIFFIWLIKHYRKTHNCRVSQASPSAKLRALGKEPLCRVPKAQHSTNLWHTACPNVAECWPLAKAAHSAKNVAECQWARTRQRPCTGPARVPTVCRPLVWLTAFSLCRVPPAGTRQRSKFAECRQLALGKVSFAECLASGSRQTGFNFFCLQIFLFYT